MDLNQIGILMNLIGAILLYFNGLPSKIERGCLLIDTGELNDEDIKEKIRNIFIVLWAQLGIALIVIGTLFQLFDTL